MKATQIYWRARGGVRRAYADLREYADVGGQREALVASGEKRATADPATAQVLLARRIEQLDGLRRGRALHGLAGQATLATFAGAHLIAKADTGKFTERWLALSEHHLERAVAHFGAGRELGSITTTDVRAWCEKLQASGLSAGTARHHLNALSNLYRRARAERVVPSGYDPVGDLLEKPVGRRDEAKWLEVPEAALLLEAARTYVPKRSDLAVPFGYPLIAAFLLTGGRRAEVLGLEVGDVSFDRKTVTFRPNDWRRLKTATSFRVVPLWPQLEAILRPYVFGAGRPPGRLLFPCYKTGEEAMLTDLRKLLDAAAARGGWKSAEIRSKMFRHTYCAARLQTLDEGAPVSVYTVAKELGHGGEAMVRRVYGHLGQMRHRAKVVEYRVEQHRKVLAERLTALGLAPPLAPRA
ncbi:MAG TPA: tyrosine-type recombinase/integrase [Gemmatimonadales bacterium]|nr:tyrosine-type recombinase/integrase [Gemmatimonadales bacterium]